MSNTRKESCPACGAKPDEFCENIVNGAYYGTYPLYTHPERKVA